MEFPTIGVTSTVVPRGIRGRRPKTIGEEVHAAQSLAREIAGGAPTLTKGTQLIERGLANHRPFSFWFRIRASRESKDNIMWHRFPLNPSSFFERRRQLTYEEKRRALGYDVPHSDPQQKSVSIERGIIPPGKVHGNSTPPARQAVVSGNADLGGSLLLIYGGVGFVLGWLVAIVTFIGVWIAAVNSVGWVFGIALGWIPAALAATIAGWLVGLLWPLIAIGVAVIIYKMTAT